MSRILVVYYSRTGNTKKVAEAVASACNADLEQISDVRQRRGLLDWFRSGREAWKGKPAEIGPTRLNPVDYELVVLGSPIWAGRVSSPMRRYLTDHAGKIPRVALFVTESGSGGAGAFSDMAELSGQTPIATLELRERELREGLEAMIQDFVSKLETACQISADSR